MGSVSTPHTGGWGLLQRRCALDSKLKLPRPVQFRSIGLYRLQEFEVLGVNEQPKFEIHTSQTPTLLVNLAFSFSIDYSDYLLNNRALGCTLAIKGVELSM